MKLDKAKSIINDVIIRFLDMPTISEYEKEKQEIHNDLLYIGGYISAISERVKEIEKKEAKNNADITYKEYQKAVSIARKYQESKSIEFKLNNKVIQKIDRNTVFKDLDLSVRLWGSLKYYLSENEGIKITADSNIRVLSKVSYVDFSNYRNVGKKSLNEFVTLCVTAGIKIKP